jgi:hypothetical protein
VLSDLVTQRWGVGSTQLHLDMEALALGVLLFDRIVLPTPSDVAEADRWDELGWDTQAQALRIVQLGELVHFAPWDEQLRADWRGRWEHVKKIGKGTRDLAYMLTPEVIAMTAWNDVMASAGEDHLPRVRPVPVIWTSAVSSIVRRVAGNGTQRMRESDERSQVKSVAASPYEQVSALRFRRLLEYPVRDAPEKALDTALGLANSAEFQDARRALYTAEALAAAGQMPPEEFGAKIDAAVTRYNQVVAAYGGATRRRVVHHVLPFAAGKALPLSHVPGAGSAGRWLVQRVLARLLPLPPPPQPALEEGAAIGIVQHAMSAVCAASSHTQIR